MNGYRLNNILGYQLMLLGFAIGLILSQFDISMDHLVLFIVVISITVTSISFVFWKKIASFERKLKEFEV